MRQTQEMKRCAVYTRKSTDERLDAEFSSLELDAGVPIESIDTLLSAAEYFRLGKAEAEVNISCIRSAVAKWREVAVRLGIPRREQEEMAVCFKS